MSVTKAMRERHMVRRFIDRPLPDDVIQRLEERISQLNVEKGTAVRLMVNDSSAFNPITKLVLAKGVQNYLLLAGFGDPDIEERLGWVGSDLMLFAQELGLNTWWVSGTYNHAKVARLARGKRVIGVIAIGYGATQGKPHKSKAAREVSSYVGPAPEWFEQGVEAALLAPTALNRQDFQIKGVGDRVSISYKAGPFSNVDLGIVKHHFEVGAGEKNFTWA